MYNCRPAYVFSIAILIAFCLVSATSETEVRFVDVTQAAKIDFRHEASATSSKYLLETMGGGVALLDYDNDGRLDIFFTNGSHISDPMAGGEKPDKSDRKFWNRLYHQNSNGTFTDVTEKAGLTGMPQNRYNMGVAVGDFDNDGFEDIYVTGFDGNTLYHNNGNGTFTDVTKRAGVTATGWSTSAGFFDYDNDGKLDLFVCRYLKWTFQNNRYCGEHKPGQRAYCHPDNFEGATNILYHNNGDGTFTDVSETAGISNPEGKSLGVAFADYDGDGRTDIFVANDSVRCFLYHNDGNGKFSDVSLAAGTGYSEDGKTFAGMGTDFSDFDNDGRPDIVVTDLSNERYMLFHNNGDGTFTDITNSSGLGSASLAYSGWSTHFLDYDNDGWKDLFVVQGHVLDTIELTAPNLKYKQPPLLLRNVSNHFLKVPGGSPFNVTWAGRGAAFGDLDNDGDIDIVAANLNEKPYLLRNEGGNRNHWVGITTVGRRSNRDGIGCRVRVVSMSGLSQYYTVNTAIGYLSASDKRLIVGIGADIAARLVEIRWPSGTLQRFENVRAGQTLNATEPVQ
jgi:enediyne biosynthesis protein E4